MAAVTESQAAHELDYFVFDGDTDSIISDPNAIEANRSAHLLEIAYLLHIVSSFDVLNCFPNTIEDVLVLDFFQIAREALAEGCFHDLPCKIWNTSSREAFFVF